MMHSDTSERVIQTPTGPEVRLVESGSGPVCIFLQGLLGSSDHYEKTFQLLSDRAHCMVFDVHLLELKRNWANLETVTSTICDVITSESLAPAVIVGNSFGGHVALMTALNRPELVRGLVLAGSSGLAEKSYERDVQHRPSKPWLQKKIAQLFADPDYPIDSLVNRAYTELSNPHKALALVKLARSTKKHHLGHALPDITTPTLVLWGTEDEVTSPDAAREFARLIPNSNIKWIPDCGHAPMLECPEEFAAGIREFLDYLDKTDQEDAAA